MAKITVNIIAAMCEKSRAIGKDNGLPWPRNSHDMKFFRETTTGSVVIMGRKTFESMGSKPLPKRRNIVISRKLDASREDITVARSLDEAMAMGREFCTLTERNNIFIIGGSEIYKEALSPSFSANVDRMLLTLFSEDYPADAFFPEFDKDVWQKDHLILMHEETPRVSNVVLKVQVYQNINRKEPG